MHWQRACRDDSIAPFLPDAGRRSEGNRGGWRTRSGAGDNGGHPSGGWANAKVVTGD